MKQEVYADLYILVNAGMDLLCLMITAALLHRKPARWRALLGAVAGGGYALASLLSGQTGVVVILADIAAVFVICVITFAGKGVRIWELLRLTAVNALISALLGGVMTALFSWLNRLELPLELLQGDSLSIWLFALLAGTAGILTVKGGRAFRNANKTDCVTVEAVLLGTPVTLLAMVDSGNLLRDPVSGKSVIVADREKLRRILPPALCADTPDLTGLEHSIVRKLRLIPTHSATGGSMLTAIVPDSILITDRRGSRVPSDYLIAPAPLSLVGYDALIPG